MDTIATKVQVTNLPALPAGTSNIGDVDIASALPAGDNNIGNVDVVTLPALPAGNNNIGDVDVASLPALPTGTNNIGDVDVATQPARAATTDAITAKLATDKIMDGLTALTPKFAAIAAASQNANQIVAANATKKIRVLAYLISSSGSVNAKWQSASTDLTGLLYMDGAAKGAVGPFSPVGLFETAANEALNLNLSAAQAVGGYVVYVEV